MNTLNEFTLVYLRSLFSYDSKTGIVTRRVSRGNRALAGAAVGRANGNGYLRVGIDGQNVYVHRLAYFLHHGTAPIEVDHKNLKRDDNRIRNLRAAGRAGNTANTRCRKHNASGFKGVHVQNKTGRYRAQIKVDGRTRHLGYFDTRQEAHAAYAKGAKKFFGRFARAA